MFATWSPVVLVAASLLSWRHGRFPQWGVFAFLLLHAFVSPQRTLRRQGILEALAFLCLSPCCDCCCPLSLSFACFVHLMWFPCSPPSLLSARRAEDLRYMDGGLLVLGRKTFCTGAEAVWFKHERLLLKRRNTFRFGVETFGIWI